MFLRVTNTLTYLLTYLRIFRILKTEDTNSRDTNTD